MNDSQRCHPTLSLPDKGQIQLTSQTPLPAHLLAQLETLLSWEVKQTVPLSLMADFKAREDLFQLAKLLQSHNPRLAGNHILIKLRKDQALNGSPPKTEPFQWWEEAQPLDVWLEKMEKESFLFLLQNEAVTFAAQPIYQLDAAHSTAELYGYELLMRPMGLAQRPDQLFALARTMDLHVALDALCRQKAIELSMHCLPGNVKRFINFLPTAIYNPEHCLRETFATIDRLKAPADLFVFEVVETEAVQNICHLQHIFDTCQQHGIQVALDDVCSGHNTLDMLIALQPHYAKLDRSVISHIDTEPHQQRLVSALVDLCATYNITLLAEGIESEEEWRCLKSLGVSLGQGYWLGRPQLLNPA
ncbi:diguanylate phosphodiesterase [Caldalkalibacillus thermarum TA2.A1]|uniref:Diguanylate phosphodiesterase n=1 Tax=Caldalkalibacillus thermarum (strain TA2.A1) TaxID=986075 RepID=F5L5B9_CALTT|nr:EAL domain-containing protein [Caldalkalibacillus thermarum]EGL83454.1 diguanylate phosphodiesterase [Caldalkalibacillus thermarum TA2.A1]QZT34920.1 EAL domain-containing protein [Caldalkalibacillus thermarum TA2.A1]